LLQGVLSVPQPGTSPSTAAIILRSRKAMVDLINQFHLGEEWHRSLERSPLRYQDRFVCYEGKAVDLRIAFTARAPERAKKVIESSLGMLKQAVEDLSLDPAARNVDFLHKSLVESEANCNHIQAEVVRLQRGLGGSPPDTKVQALSTNLNDLEKELTNATVEAKVAASSMKATSETAMRMVRAAQDPTGTGSALIHTLYQTVTQRESELALLQQKYTDRRPEVVQARQTLSVARKALQEEIARQMEGVKEGTSPLVRDAVMSVITSRAREEGLRQSASEVRRELEDLPAAQVRYAQLQADLRDERTRLSLLRAESARADLIVQSRGPQFVTLDPPILPKRPNGWELYYWTIAGALVGGVGVGIVALSAWLRRSLQDMGM